MLRKLMKYEFRATVRIMGPVYLLVLLLALAANFSAETLSLQSNTILNLLGGILILAFSIGIMGVCFLTLVTMIRRFQQNLLGDEGYLMFTLPASVSSHVWSKLLISALWFFLTGVVVLLAMFFMAFGLRDLPGFHELVILWDGFWDLPSDMIWQVLVVMLELFLLLFVGCCTACLEIYASMAIGYSLPRHKLACSVGVFFGLQFLTQFLIGLVMNYSWMMERLFFLIDGLSLNGPETAILGLLVTILGVMLYGAIFYFLTTFFLKKRLNLE